MNRLCRKCSRSGPLRGRKAGWVFRKSERRRLPAGPSMRTVPLSCSPLMSWTRIGSMLTPTRLSGTSGSRSSSSETSTRITWILLRKTRGVSPGSDTVRNRSGSFNRSCTVSGPAWVSTCRRRKTRPSSLAPSMVHTVSGTGRTGMARSAWASGSRSAGSGPAGAATRSGTTTGGDSPTLAAARASAASMVRRTTAGSAGLRRASSAPASKARTFSLGSVMAVSTMTGMAFSAGSPLRRRQTSKPSIPGIMMSSRMRAGRSRAASSSAVGPSRAVRTV